MIPALDTATFEHLIEELDSHAVALEFVISFESLLADRIQRIERALKDQDREEVITALLSLHASAAMVGAAQLEASATRALGNEPVETTPPGPLVRKLQGQAALFRGAFADLHHPQTTPVTQSLPLGELA